MNLNVQDAGRLHFIIFIRIIIIVFNIYKSLSLTITAQISPPGGAVRAALFVPLTPLFVS